MPQASNSINLREDLLRAVSSVLAVHGFQPNPTAMVSISPAGELTFAMRVRGRTQGKNAVMHAVNALIDLEEVRWTIDTPFFYAGIEVWLSDFYGHDDVTPWRVISANNRVFNLTTDQLQKAIKTANVSGNRPKRVRTQLKKAQASISTWG